MLRKVEPITLGCDVRIEGDNIAVTGLFLHDAELASYVGEHPEVDRPAIVERGLKVGLIALRNAGVTLNVDFVAREFDRLMHRTDESHDRAAVVLDSRNGLDALRQVVLDRVLSIEGNVADVTGHAQVA